LGLFVVPLAPRLLRFPHPHRRPSPSSRSSMSTVAPSADMALDHCQPSLSMRSWSALAHGRHPCPMCHDHLSTPFDSYHVLVECTYPAVVVARRNATLELPQLLEVISYTCAKARSATGRVPSLPYLAPRGPPPASNRVRMTAQSLLNMGWSSVDGKFCLFRLLCVSPWSSWHLPGSPSPPPDSLCSMLAVTFDSTRAPHRHFRPMAHAWASWAGEAILTICNAWSSSLTASPLLQSLQ
jgi:hypothetical protein